MNEIERLKKAEEAEPMAVLVIPYPKSCVYCPCHTEEYCWHSEQVLEPEDLEDMIPNWCELRKAIGIIEPDGHVRYFVEDDNGNAD